MRGRPLEGLGPTIKNWRHVVGLGLILGGVQFFLTLYGYQLPAPVDWVPLLTMALMVGHFEAIFFRGLPNAVQRQLRRYPRRGCRCSTVRVLPSRLPHGARERVFLFGLGLAYGIAYACVNNVLVLWPVLIPNGSFYNNLQASIDLP